MVQGVILLIQTLFPVLNFFTLSSCCSEFYINTSFLMSALKQFPTKRNWMMKAIKSWSWTWKSRTNRLYQSLPLIFPFSTLTSILGKCTIKIERQSIEKKKAHRYLKIQYQLNIIDPAPLSSNIVKGKTVRFIFFVRKRILLLWSSGSHWTIMTNIWVC